MTLLTVDHVSKVYGKNVKANDDISLVVDAGEVFGLLGPNGAGKTTLVNQIIGLVAPTSGTIKLNGVDIVADPGYARRACSFQPQSHVPVEGLTLWQSISFIGRIRGGHPTEVERRSKELIAALQIEEWIDERGELLSGGVKRLVAFCMAAVVPGRLVILDEPTNDVDPLRRQLMWREVRRMAEAGSAVLLVTHNVLEAERSVDRLAIISQGRVLGAGTPASLKQYDQGRLRLELVLKPNGSSHPVPPFPAERIVTGRRQVARIKVDQVQEALKWAQDLSEKQIIEEYVIGLATLEDVYARFVGESGDESNTKMEETHVNPITVAS